MVQLTVSIGYARLTLANAPTECIERADKALYYLKELRRNAVENSEG
ncbi:MAG: hypothetical protein K6L76_08770 [Agarilytica sp.]